MRVQLKLYGSSKLLDTKEILNIELPENSKIKKLRNVLSKLIYEKKLENDLKNLPSTAAFFSEKNEVVNDSYKLTDKELISIIPPIGGG